MARRHVTLIQDGRVRMSGVFGRTYIYTSDAALVAIVERLIGQGVAFVHEPAGWPPAAVLGKLQADGLLTIPFTAITWRGPGDFHTFQVPASGSDRA
jgi:hypothetical protein